MHIKIKNLFYRLELYLGNSLAKDIYINGVGHQIV